MALCNQHRLNKSQFRHLLCVMTATSSVGKQLQSQTPPMNGHCNWLHLRLLFSNFRGTIPSCLLHPQRSTVLTPFYCTFTNGPHKSGLVTVWAVLKSSLIRRLCFCSFQNKVPVITRWVLTEFITNSQSKERNRILLKLRHLILDSRWSFTCCTALRHRISFTIYPWGKIVDISKD